VAVSQTNKQTTFAQTNKQLGRKKAKQETKKEQTKKKLKEGKEGSVTILVGGNYSMGRYVPWKVGSLQVDS